MSDEPLTNAAVEWMRETYERMNELAELPSIASADSFTDDFVVSDRRRGVNFGEGDASYYVRMFEGFWEAGGRPHFSIVEVIAVRGDWSAAYRERIVYGGSDMYLEQITVVDHDPAADSWRRFVLFDPDDRDAAIAELDRMHAENDTEPNTPA
jgi:hypothetical protein